MAKSRGVLRGSLAALLLVLLLIGTLTGLFVVSPARALPGPHITRLIPTSGPAGTHVAITGSGFFATTAVSFAGAPAHFRVVNADLIQAVVPRTAGSGPVAVRTGFGNAVSPTSFTVTPSLWLSRRSAWPSNTVSVGGSGFGPSEQVRLSLDSLALPTATTNHSGVFALTFTVPGAAPPGSHLTSATGQASGRMASAPFQVNDDWPMFQSDLTHTGVNPDETVLSPSTVSGLSPTWSFCVCGPFILSQAAVVDGVVYVGNKTEMLTALDASTGSLIWRFDTGNYTSVFTSPAVANGMVYFGTYYNDNGTFGGVIDALDAATGTLKWSYDTGSPIESSPVVTGGIVYFGSESPPYNLYALDANTGTLVWSYATGGRIFSSPAVANGVVYTASSTGTIYALNATTGAFVWSYAFGNGINSSPAVVNGVVYIGSFSNQLLYALNATNGSLLWSYSAAGDSIDFSSPAVANNVVYIGSYQDGTLYALNASTGALLWTYTTGKHIESSPVVANGVVYFGSEDYNVYALNASTGAVLWKYTTGYSVDASPTVVGGMVFIGSQDSNFYAFALSTP